MTEPLSVGSWHHTAAETELALIGGLFNAPDRIGAVSLTGLEEWHFLDITMGSLWSRIRQTAGRGEGIDIRTVVQAGASIIMGGAATPTQLQARMLAVAGMSSSLVGYARAIKAYWALRRVSDQAEIISSGIQSRDAMELVSDVLASVDEVREVTLDRRGSARALVSQIADRLGKRAQAMMNGDAPRPPETGLADLDKRLPMRGLSPGALVVMAGRTGMGKTMLASSVASRVARKGHGVAFFSLEVPSEEIAARVVCEQLGGKSPPYGDVMSGRVTPAELEAFMRASEGVQGWPLYLDDTAGQTMADIAVSVAREGARMERNGIPLELVVIDHAQIVKPTGRYSGNRVGELGEVANAAKVMAKQNNCCVILCSQVNRGVEGREDKRPNLSDLRASGEVEEAADAVLMLYREAYYIERSKEYREGDPSAAYALDNVRNHLEIGVEKSRQGSTGRATVWCDPARSIVANLQGGE